MGGRGGGGGMRYEIGNDMEVALKTELVIETSSDRIHVRCHTDWHRLRVSSNALFGSRFTQTCRDYM